MNIKKQNLSDLAALLLVAGVFFIAKKTAGERPQLFTFFVFSLVYYLLEDFRINRSKKVFLVPILVMLLSNMHPGYIVCILLITLYLAGEGLRCLINRDYKDSILKGLLMIWISTIIFSALNPNGTTMLTGIFSIHGDYTKGIVEFMSPFYLYVKKIMQVHYSYIIFLVFSLLGLRYFRRIGIIHMLLLVVFTIMSFVSNRYMIFYMGISAPIIARMIIYLREEKVFEKLTGALKRREGFLNVIACVIGIFLIFSAVPSFARYEFKEDSTFAFPKGAAEFLDNLKINGHMFNEYAFGGYLIWRLYPDKMVFIDGRSLELDVLTEYVIVGSAKEWPRPSWEDIIKKYNISYIVMSPLKPSGEIFPIVEKLLDSEGWVLIYMDHLSFIFLRNDIENLPIIKRFAIDKRGGFNTIIIQASARAMKNRVNPYYLITIGKVFFKMGKLDDAEKAFLKAYKRAPNNLVVKEWLRKLKIIDKNDMKRNF